MAHDAVSAVVVGNSSTEMLVFSHRERVQEAKEIVTERFEAMQLGVAVQTGALLQLSHEEWGGTLEAFLVGQQLLVELAPDNNEMQRTRPARATGPRR
jgi:hypothetical protein